jgi:hypothetical protein
LAKIAVEFGLAVTGRIMASGPPRDAKARVWADGDSWTFEDVICTCGPPPSSSRTPVCQRSDAIVAGGIFSIARPKPTVVYPAEGDFERRRLSRWIELNISKQCRTHSNARSRPKIFENDPQDQTRR